ncbi:MAG: hypothetical protein R2698_09120 [Microthrixaceae bacterium]
MASTLGSEQLGRLRLAALGAHLKRTRPGDDRVVAEVVTASGAHVMTASRHVVALVEQPTRRSFGGPLTWALRGAAGSLELVVGFGPGAVDEDEVAGHLARLATGFGIETAVLRRLGAAATLESLEPVAPAPLPLRGVLAESEPADPTIESAVASVRAAGFDVEWIDEWGVRRVELRGLEVARVVRGARGPTGTAPHAQRLEVGVGRVDREIASMAVGTRPDEEVLVRAVELVDRVRRPGAPPHPLRDLVPARWLRATLLGDPTVVGATDLSPIGTTVRFDGLREIQPAAAAGTALDGAPLVVVCTAGVDLDVVPLALDTAASFDQAGGHHAPATLVICGPSRSLLDATRIVAAAADRPIRFEALELPY